MPVIDLSAWGQSPSQPVWVFLDTKLGRPLAAFKFPDGPCVAENLAVMAWLTREAAVKYQHHNKLARKARLVPWSLSQTLTWCQKNGVTEIVPDHVAGRVAAPVVYLTVESMVQVIARAAASNN